MWPLRRSRARRAGVATRARGVRPRVGVATSGVVDGPQRRLPGQGTQRAPPMHAPRQWPGTGQATPNRFAKKTKLGWGDIGGVQGGGNLQKLGREKLRTDIFCTIFPLIFKD